MDYLNLLELKQLTAFFVALDRGYFKTSSAGNAIVRVNGIKINKADSLKLLREKFPGLNIENLKDDSSLIRFLSNPKNRDFVLSKIDSAQLPGFRKALDLTEKAVITEEPGGQMSGEATGEQGAPTTGGMPNPFAPSTSSPVIHSAPRTSPPHKGGNEAANAPKVPNTQLRNPLQEQGPATAKINRLQATAANPGLRFQTGLGSSLKTLGSNAGIFAKRNLGRIANGLTNSVLPAGANLLGRTGLGAINYGGNFLSNLSNTRLRVSQSIRGAGSGISSSLAGGRKVALASILAFLLIFGIAINGAMTGTTPTGEASPITTGGGDIASCKFTRGDMTPKEASFQSNLLLSYIQEAAQKSSIPPAVLAAFIRVESSSLSNSSDDEIKNYRCIKSGPGKNVSVTGALGIMQIQPPGTTSAAGDPASCEDCIDAGAKLIGKNVSTMTEADYCDPRTSIIVGAGWILKKMTYWGYGDGTKWDPAWTNDKKAITTLVNTYYGDVLYPDVNTGPFNYADDVSTSIQNCQTVAPVGTTTHPTAPTTERAKLRDALITQFGITMNGFDEEHLQWAWEKLWDISSTNFIALTKGSIIVQDSYSEQVGCPGPSVAVYLNQYPETLFKYALIHELGHVIRNCNKTSISMFSEHLNALDKERGVTYYANNAWSCTESDNPSEDYAEMIALYLNPSANIQMVGCAPTSTKYTNLATDFPLHYNVARSVLGVY